jgi:2-polyprenyl-6-methoxyphenol hydroxylase-like FAD-dependent oxidoreductase
MEEKTQVLICGGSAVGMSTALFLSHLGVPCVVVEKKDGPSGHPGFRGLSARTMELYRTVGVEEDINAAAGEQHRHGSVARARNLSAPEVSWFDLLPWAEEYAHVSPCVYTTCDQDLLEPVLRDNAAARGADIRYATELIEWDQDDRGVRALVRHAGCETTIRAAYLVAADGVHSSLREGAGIASTGPGTIEHRVNVMFNTDLDTHLQGRRLTACLASDINGGIVPRETRPWVMSVPFPPGYTRLEHVPEEYWHDLLRAGVGHEDFRAEIVDVLAWRAAAQVAVRFRHGRLFLAGDAAHAMPPTGGFAGNSGIQDAFNLAWKLAEVTGGDADPALLDSYEAERRPVAEFTVEQALLRLRSWFGTAGGPPPREPVDDNTVMFGYRYQPEGTDVFENPLEPLAQPGCRAPNLRIGPTAAPRSIVDLFGRGFVLLCGPCADAWHEAAQPMGQELSCYRIGSSDELSDVDAAWADTYHVTDAGAVLVRPDGFIAWRATDGPVGTEEGAAAEVLGGALRRLRLGAGQIVPA